MSSPAQITEHQFNAHPKRFSRENRSTTNPGAIIPHESRHEFQRLIAEYTGEFHPATEHQRYLVWQLADARFRIARMNRFEQCLWDIIDDTRKCPTEDHRIVHDMMQRGRNIYDQLHRYRTAAERTYNKAIKELASFCKTKETLPIPPSGSLLLASCSGSSGSFCKTEPPKPQASEKAQTPEPSAPQAKQAAPAEPSPAPPTSSGTIGFVLQNRSADTPGAPNAG